MIKTRGKVDAPVVIVGDQPTPDDEQSGAAFSGDQGATIIDYVLEAGFKSTEVLFVNALSFRKRTSGPLSGDQIREDAQEHLLPVITQHPRKVIIALGNNALCALGVIPKPAGVTAMRLKRLKTKYKDADKNRAFDAVVVASTNPWIIMKEPDEADELQVDLAFALRTYRGHNAEQVPVHVIEISKPGMIEDLARDSYGDLIAYDHETDTKMQEDALIVMSSFSNGNLTEAGERIGWVWTGYDQLKPCFERHVRQQFKEAFDWFYTNENQDYDFIAFNMGFDDWVTETMLGHRIRGSKYDVMFMKWLINNLGPNDLKVNTAKYLGYPNYDKPVDDAVAEIVKRRSKMLHDQRDFDTLRRWGLSPEAKVLKNGKTNFYWNKLLDKKIEAWAMVDTETLKLYNVYDAVYTRMLFEVLAPMIKQYGLTRAMKLRHRIGRLLMRCEQRGFLLDIETNKRFEKELTQIEKDCKAKIEEVVQSIKPGLKEFNPGSDQQLAQVLYGEPEPIPSICMDSVIEQSPSHFAQKEYFFLRRDIDAFQNDFYSDYDALMSALQDGSFDYEATAKQLATAFVKRFKREGYQYCRIVPHLVYPQGLYEPIAYTKTGRPSCAGVVLTSLIEQKDSELLSLVLMLRKASKINSTFVRAIRNKVDENNILRGRFNPIGTKTGRISSSGPNCQNFPKAARGQLIARPGYRLLDFDLSQAEVRAVAAYSNDRDLIEALNSEDIHRKVASLIHGISEAEVTDVQRTAAKTIVFGIVYGMSSYRLSLALKITVEEADAFIAQFFGRFPGLAQWLKDQVTAAYEPPHKARTPWGTQRSVRNVLSPNKQVVGHAERIAANMPIQGAAGELTLYYLCEIMDECGRRNWDVHLVNTTHDSGTLETPEDMVWAELITDKKGNPILTDKGKKQWRACGPVADLVREVIARPAPVAPLNAVNFKADMEVNLCWNGKPNLRKALDPKKKMRWDLLKPEDVLTADEQKELKEIEEVMTAA